MYSQYRGTTLATSPDAHRYKGIWGGRYQKPDKRYWSRITYLLTQVTFHRGMLGAQVKLFKYITGDRKKDTLGCSNWPKSVDVMFLTDITTGHD